MNCGVLVNQKISMLRKEKGMSMATLAERTGISQPTISKYENGIVQTIDRNKLLKIAESLDVTIDDLICEDPRYTQQRQRNTNRRQDDLVAIQNDTDKALLYSFHRLSEDTQHTVVHLCEIIASTSAVPDPV